MHFIPAKYLEPGMILATDVLNRNKHFMLAAGTPLNEKFVLYLQEKGYLGAYIKDSDTEDAVIHESVSTKTFQSGVNAVARANVLEIVSVSKEIVSELSQLDKVSIDLLDLRSYDDYTFHHSVNVGVYAVAVGKVMGLDSEDLETLAVAALCHDLGKNKIPTEIINKNGRLTDEEFTIIKKHPKYSYDILYENNSISAVIRQAVLMHHENEDGTGYPLGKGGSDIPIFAKIIHAVDVYDALTSKRPYKEPYSHMKAYEFMDGGIDSMFAESIIKAMKHVLPKFPPCVSIALSNGERAVVLDQTGDVDRPYIRIDGTGKRVNLETDPAYKDVTIVAAENATFDFTEEVESLNEGRGGTKTLKKTVVIVDDSNVELMRTKTIIGSDYKVVEFNDGMEALNYIKKKTPDLIIIDVDLPLVSGISVVKVLRETGFRDIPVIFLTAKCDRQTVLEGKAVGANDFIIKPANPTYLQERVNAAINREIHT